MRAFLVVAMALQSAAFFSNAGAFLVGVPAAARAQLPAPARPQPLLRHRECRGRGLHWTPAAASGAHGSTPDERGESSAPDKRGESEQPAAGACRRRFAAQLISGLVEGKSTQRFPDAVGLWLQAPQATKEERRALAGVWSPGLPCVVLSSVAGVECGGEEGEWRAEERVEGGE